MVLFPSLLTTVLRMSSAPPVATAVGCVVLFFFADAVYDLLLGVPS